MQERKLNYRFHDPNPAAVTVDYILNIFIEANAGKVEAAIQEAATGALETLVRRSRLFSYSKVHYFLFSKSGLTKGCMERANELGSVTLVEYAEMLKSYGV